MKKPARRPVSADGSCCNRSDHHHHRCGGVGGAEQASVFSPTKVLVILVRGVMTSISPSLQDQLRRLSPDQRRQVSALLHAMQDSSTQATSAPRQPGGLMGKLHTHADFDAPLAEEFLLP